MFWRIPEESVPAIGSAERHRAIHSRRAKLQAWDCF
jgi:hypothetical protein